ncbi:plasmid mobilization relaxosome protein MobC [Petroclostridium sp. X23]|uniref:plasmid mobilization protein n=1 Tax=Petroclostridium sp. X23 TaxID=3045146 RepID=UPI0024AE5AE6|nr:plasmid mobilization relaxosome protein MobC [Petroclostridium sp. X23]WHH59753.1 plasmid mobilization relaxosome protein MobC [Petroclostridium sp. X23]
MLKRSIKVTFRMNTREFQRLKTQVKKTGLSQEAFIRSLINGYIPKELPPLDYFSMMRELHAIGNNLNQLAAKANAIGHIDKAVFQYEANRLRRVVQDIQEAVTSPERRESYGNNSNMGCNRPP